MTFFNVFVKRSSDLHRVVLIVAVVSAALLRLWALDIKPAHFDEGVNGWFVDQMTKNGYYAYDPTNYHGPLHFYVLHASQTLLGRNLWALRLPLALVGIFTVLAIWALRRFLPQGACLWAALFAAVSPALTFYSRYAIHESWQTLFLITGTYGVLGVLTRNARKDLWVLMLSGAALVLTKETYAIHAAVAAVALVCMAVYERFMPSLYAQRVRSGDNPEKWFVSPQWGACDALAAVATSLGLLIFFYSGTFLNWSGVVGLFEAHAAWFATGTAGNGHEKPFYYWLELLARFEWPGMLGLLSIPVLALSVPRTMRLVGIYALGVVLAYSIIPYKTPWCILAILPHLLLCAGFLLDKIASLQRTHKMNASMVGAMLVGTLAVGHSVSESLRVNFREFTNDAHPYVYVQTYEDIYRLVGPLQERARREPSSRHLPGEILIESYYPLPWILGDFSHVAYRSPDARPAFENADWVVIEKSQAEEIEQRLPFDAVVEDFRLRSGQSECRVYFRATTFRHQFPDREPDFRNQLSDQP